MTLAGISAAPADLIIATDTVTCADLVRRCHYCYDGYLADVLADVVPTMGYNVVQKPYAAPFFNRPRSYYVQGCDASQYAMEKPDFFLK